MLWLGGKCILDEFWINSGLMYNLLVFGLPTVQLELYIWFFICHLSFRVIMSVLVNTAWDLRVWRSVIYGQMQWKKRLKKTVTVFVVWVRLPQNKKLAELSSKHLSNVTKIQKLKLKCMMSTSSDVYLFLLFFHILSP